MPIEGSTFDDKYQDLICEIGLSESVESIKSRYLIDDRVERFSFGPDPYGGSLFYRVIDNKTSHTYEVRYTWSNVNLTTSHIKVLSKSSEVLDPQTQVAIILGGFWGLQDNLVRVLSSDKASELFDAFGRTISAILEPRKG
ncbi:MAG: hypothetical protein UT34_C0001G0031 [candidate division WS6 bacterium GW2011_GWF2_39_15]|uniref:Uncharacterized protein n=1 Tax=candidate division WS6 bacterium GW2011_GWF2_39_15 TaxID=1619100 RepID=A0A0G0MZF8_9BACT|nr:MAG: hypothetical protein UT34_C0001G0031 [candidate division WS6 bacterium GW2011_GWF2_39_15]